MAQKRKSPALGAGLYGLAAPASAPTKVSGKSHYQGRTRPVEQILSTNVQRDKLSRTQPRYQNPAVGGRTSDDGATGEIGGYRGSDLKPQRNELSQCWNAARLSWGNPRSQSPSRGGQGRGSAARCVVTLAVRGTPSDRTLIGSIRRLRPTGNNQAILTRAFWL